jgi:hypothetical protein
MQQNSNASLSKRVGQTWFCHFQRRGEKGTIVLKYQLEKLLKEEMFIKTFFLSLMTIILMKRFHRIEFQNSSNKIYIYYDHWIN